jgi:hypothetical protein
MPHPNSVVNKNSHKVEEQLEGYQLQPTEVLQEAIHMFPSEHPLQVLTNAEEDSPNKVDDAFHIDGSLVNDLVSPDKIEEGQQTPPMHPDRQPLNVPGVDLPVLDDALPKEHP